MKVLLIEDEPKLLRSISNGLREQNIEVDTATDGIAGLQLSENNSYNVIVSDVIMPGRNGIELLRKLREAHNQTPVILLTALGQTDDKVTGFEAGADDYLTKPFEFRELLLRIRALARRHTAFQQQNTVLKWGPLTMNLDSRDLYREKQKIALTPREFALMEYLIRNPGRVISKNEILENVWDLHFDIGTNLVEVYMNFLRKKVEKGFDQKIIHTQFKTGYILQIQE